MLFRSSDKERDALIKKFKANEPAGGYKDINTAWYLLYLFGSAVASIICAFYLGDTSIGRSIQPIGLFLIPFILCLALGLFLLKWASNNLNIPHNTDNP